MTQNNEPHIETTPIVWDNYLDWHQQMLAPQDRADLYEPVFIRIAGETAQIVQDRLSDLQNLVISDDGLLMDSHELAMLSEATATISADPPREFMVYRPMCQTPGAYCGLTGWMQILDIGMPVRLRAQTCAEPLSPQLGNPDIGLGATAPIVAAIDDSFAFLNDRFRRRLDDSPKGMPRYGTRIDAVWLQSQETACQKANGETYVRIGQVIARPEIETILAKSPKLDEVEEYRKINTLLHGNRPVHRASEHMESHGTHILDLAAGADPDLTQNQDLPPILAVQLPPAAVADTSGQRLESFVIQGVRWILRRASDYQVNPRPVIINISLGFMAGSKDGTHFLEVQIARELAAWETAHGARARVVYSYGNGLRNRQVAQLDVVGRDPTTQAPGQDHVNLRLQPDDRTVSHVEIHSQGLSDLTLELIAPDGRVTPFDIGSLLQASSTLASLKLRQPDPAVGLYYIAKRRGFSCKPTTPYLAISLAPTARHAIVAQPGAWQIRLTNRSAICHRVRLEVQRDDTLLGRPLGGRQPYFEAPEQQIYDAKMRDHSGLSDQGPITLTRTHSALTSGNTPRAYAIGAAVEAGLEPARYAAAGARHPVPGGPDASAIADTTPGLLGVLATGTFSGSVRAFNGSSVAAPQFVRGLAQCNVMRDPPSGDPARDKADEITEIVARFGTVVDAQFQHQLGLSVIRPPKARRQRIPDPVLGEVSS